ncbi:MAG: methylated-DNA--[protein]-cysteine S-methyltransferase [Promethearchaeota archaeon]
MSGFEIHRIYLSDPDFTSEAKATSSIKGIKLKQSSAILSLGKKIQLFFKGEDIKFDLGLCNFDGCFAIQKKVLLVEFEIPRGWVSTYKRIAVKIGIPDGARAVGNALARNPFPIIIPCHRAIKSNGELGGYQGGTRMKQKLLESEGLEFSDKGKVITEKLYY